MISSDPLFSAGEEQVGEHKTVEGPGALSLGINDTADAFGDNTGAFHVSITVARGEEVAKVLQIYSGHLYVRRDGSDRVSALHARRAASTSATSC